MKKKFSNLKSLKYKSKNNNTKNKIKYHLDDKGRRIFDLSSCNFESNNNIIITNDDNIITKDSIIKEKKIQKQKRYENLNKNLLK